MPELQITNMLHTVTCQNYKLLIATRSNMPELQITNMLHAVTCQNYKLLTCYTQ